MIKKIEGVISVVPTPLKEDETIDLDSLNLLVERLVKYEMPMFCLGSAGEAMNLSYSERVNAAISFSRANNGRVPLLVGCGGYGTRDVLNFINEIKSEKIDGVHLIPYDGKVSPNIAERLIRDVADNSPIPVWIYQNPTRTKAIPLEIVKSLSKHLNVHGMKLAGFDLRFNQSFIDLHREDFQVFGSADIQMFSFLAHGLKASSSSAAICFPEIFILLYDAIKGGDLNKARDLNRKITAFLKRIPKNAYKENGESAAEVKYILKLQNICGEKVASPWVCLNDIDKNVSRKVLKSYDNYLKTKDINELLK